MNATVTARLVRRLFATSLIAALAALGSASPTVAGSSTLWVDDGLAIRSARAVRALILTPPTMATAVLITIIGVDDVSLERLDLQTIAFMQGLGMKGVERERVAYVLADRPTTSTYTPDPDHRYSSAGGTNRITRQGLGAHTVILPGMPLGGNAQVNRLRGS